MKSQELKKVVNDYSLLDSPSYAIMICGPWGCGKTHLIKSSFDGSDKKMIYVSLYGVSSLEQIKDKIFTSLMSIDEVSEEEVQKTSRFIGNIIKVFSEAESGSAVGSIVSTVGSTIKSRILNGLNKDITLIFDDLERSPMSASQALSCVNDFVEHQGLNAIVLCDESRIKDDDYKSYKEKLILYTYRIDYAVEEKVTIAFGERSCIPSEIREASESELFRLLKNIECNNLRTLKLAILSYSKLIQALHEHSHKNKCDPKLVRLIFPCLAYAIGYRDMELTDRELLSFSDDQLTRAFLLQAHNSKDGKEHSEWNKFYKDVVQKSSNSIEVESAYKMVCLGYSDYSTLCNDIEKWEPITHSPKMNIIHANYNFSDTEFDTMVKSLIDSIRSKDLEVCSGQELISLSRQLHYLVKNGAVDYSVEDLEAELSDFVDDVIDNGKYENPEIRYGAEKSDNAFIKGIDSKVRDCLVQNKDNNEVSNLQGSLMTVITSIDEDEIAEASSKLYNNTTKPFISLEFVDISIKRVQDATPKQLDDFYQLLRCRYSSANIFEFLGNEIPALESFMDKLATHSNILTPSLTKFHIESLIRMINNVLTTRERYEK